MQSLDGMLVERFIWNCKYGFMCRRLYGEKGVDFYIRVKRSYNKPYHSLDISSPAIEIFNLILDDPSRFSCEKIFNYNLTNSTSEGSHYYSELDMLATHMSNSKYLRTSNCIENCHLTLTDKITKEKFKFLECEESYYLLTREPFSEDEEVVFTKIFRQWCQENLKTPKEIERERLTKIYCKEK